MHLHVDKVAHYGLSGMMTLVGQMFVPLWIAAVVVFFIGVAKEVHDGTEYNVFSIADIVANVSGIGTVWLCLTI